MPGTASRRMIEPCTQPQKRKDQLEHAFTEVYLVI